MDAQTKALLITDTTFRDAHQSLIATRVRTYDMLAVADAVARRTPQLFSWKCGAARPSTPRCVSCTKTRGDACACLREKIPNICFQMLFRGSNAVGYSNYPDNVVAGFVKHAAGAGMDIFRVFDSLNYTAESQGGDGSRAGNARHLRSGDLLHRRHPRSRRATSIR
jgi:pyruvate carboxylase